MPWSIHLPPDLPIVETRYVGLVSIEEVTASATELLAVVGREGRRALLTDCTEMTGGHSLTDLYGVIDMLAGHAVTRQIKEALLMSQLPDTAEKVRFWETACGNRGIQVRVFEDRAAALAWLLE